MQSNHSSKHLKYLQTISNKPPTNQPNTYTLSSKASATNKLTKKHKKPKHYASKTTHTTTPNLDLSESNQGTSLKQIKLKHQREKIQERLEKLGLTGAFQGELN